MSKHSLLALVAFAASATPLVAQRTRVYESRPRDTVVLRSFGGPMARTLSASRRAIIGVTLDLRPSANDSLGATVSAVTPGGPAARAGLVGGDIIIKFDGTALADRTARADNDDEEDNDQSAPGLRMLELAARMAPNDTVTVEWKHDRARKTARVVADAAPTMIISDGGPDVRLWTNEGPGTFRYRVGTGDNGPAELLQLQGRLDALRGHAMSIPGMDGGNFFMRFGGPFGGVQFAPLNADLGRYFGTSDGILVLETPDSSTHVDLKGGDVILAIGDRKPTSVEHLFRILESYTDSETVHFDVMRDKRHVAVDAKADDLRSSGRMKIIEDNLRDPDERVPMEPPHPDRPMRKRSTNRSGT
jgi:hypothetical protein